MKRVASHCILVCFQFYDSCRRRMREGVLRYAGLSGWHVKIVYVRDKSALLAAVRRHRPDGLVLNVYFAIPWEDLGAMPVVCLACEENGRATAGLHVCYDSASTARLAARELSSTGCRNFAFASIDWDYDWSHMRGRAFKSEIEQRGGTLVVPFLSSSVKLTAHDRVELGRWVAELPKPCGVFASNDAMARGVIDACQRQRIAVPEDVAVVGVDDDFKSCQCIRPTLTTVVPDWCGGGFIALSTLADVFRGGPKSGVVRLFHPIGICRRESTGRRYSTENFRVIKAMDLIRNRSCFGLDVPTVVCEMGCSRRYAESLFKDTTGMSILEAIRLVRFDTAKAILLADESRVVEVARRSGYASVQTFIREFKKLTGSSPQVWRQRNAGSSKTILCANG